MQITKELLDAEIAGMEARVKDTEASVQRLTGALIAFKDLRAYLDREEVVEQPTDYISDENAAIQERDALSMQQVAELVAGEGAIAEEPQPIYDFPYDYQSAEEEELDYANR